jgi:hypothetical protein
MRAFENICSEEEEIYIRQNNIFLVLRMENTDDRPYYQYLNITANHIKFSLPADACSNCF